MITYTSVIAKYFPAVMLSRSIRLHESSFREENVLLDIPLMFLVNLADKARAESVQRAELTFSPRARCVTHTPPRRP